MDKLGKRKLYNYLAKIKYDLFTSKEQKKRQEEQTEHLEKEEQVKRELEHVRARASQFLKDSDSQTIGALPEYACTGCGACAAVCPEHAIRMVEDEEGFYSPVIDGELCTLCGKCKAACPELYPDIPEEKVEKYYAVQEGGENRKKSTAGGFFITAAQHFMRDGGYVCGAVTAQKGKRTKHVISNDPEFAVRFGKAKYMQSNLGDCLVKIADLLKKGEKVLFAGCPCQVAGLKKFLGRDYEGLLTVDLACRGVPSPGSFDQYCADTFGGEPQWIDFHSKMIYGTYGVGMRLMTPKGEEYVVSAARDPYFRSYHAGLNVRKSCGDCNYAIHRRWGDVTLAILYDMEKFNKDWNNGLSISLVEANSRKGQEFLFDIQKDYQIFQNVSESKVQKYSPIVCKPYYDAHNRDRFFELLRETYFLKALNYAQQDRYDVAVLGLWFGRNYGSMITYYALHQVLKGMGLSVLMIANPLMPPYEDTNTKTHPVKFAREHYHISEQYPLPGMWQLNAHADSFLVGSDQLWNHWLSRPYGQAYYLEFVDDYNKKIAYGTSFGGREYNGPEGQRKLVKTNLHRFDAISVREEYAVETCRKYFDVDAVKVLDPVFLCERSEYKKLLLPREELERDPYIFAYILNPDEAVGETLTRLQKLYQKKVRIILDEPPWLFEDNRKALKIKESEQICVVKNVDVKEWLSYICYSDAVVTDSFHGTCFSIIFERKFLTIINKKRARDRFPALLEPLGLMERLLEEPEMALEEGRLYQEIDYEQVYAKIEAEKTESKKWLYDAICSEKTVDMDKAFCRIEYVRKDENDKRESKETGEADCKTGL